MKSKFVHLNLSNSTDYCYSSFSISVVVYFAKVALAWSVNSGPSPNVLRAYIFAHNIYQVADQM
jgi:hypothetical protein